jgi:hypothetical protein
MTFRQGLARCLAAIAVTGMAATAAGAQQPGGKPPGGPAADMSPAQVNQLFDAMLVMQAQDALSLSEPQYAQFVSRLKVLQDTRRRNQQERVRLINELQRMTNPRNPGANMPESEIKLRLSALQELEGRSAAELRKAYNGVDEVLNPLQQARFRVLEENIERRKLQLVGRARQNNPDRPPPQRRPPGR